jgi:3'5'-cyclic nucleotide phosphodiesterase
VRHDFLAPRVQLINQPNGVAEFFTQGDKERKHGLPVTPILNRATGHLASSQLAFVTYVTKPMMESLAPILPSFVKMAQAHMEVNMMLYQEVIAEGLSGRFKTIGVDYSRILATSGAVTDDLTIEDDL